MGVIAVAGGTGRIGRTIVEAIVATKKHEVIVLARKPNPDLEKQFSIRVIPVDYADVPSVTKVLEDNSVDTVISGLVMMPAGRGPEAELPKEVELIRAADASRTTKRMISSDWGHPHPAEEDTMSIPSTKFKALAAAELAKLSPSSLKTTRVQPGYYMDFWSNPSSSIKSNYPPLAMFVDIANGAAAIPGDGEAVITFSHTTDVARYVAAMLDLPEWDEVSYVVGDRVSLNQLLAYAEEAKGTKFTVTYDPVSLLKAGTPTELPSYTAAYKFLPKPVLIGMVCTFGVWFAEGVLDYPTPGSLNEKFPEIGSIKVREMIEKAWKKE